MFFFLFNRKRPAPPLQIDPEAVIGRLMPYAPPDKSGFLTDDDESLLVQCLHWNTRRSRLEPAPLNDRESGIHAASWARLDNRDELANMLAIAPAELAALCDTELIVRTYLKWGEGCVEHLIGDFVFIIHDRRNNRVFCGRDQMGVRPFYYFASDDLFVCATSLAALRRLERVPLKVDPQWVAEYLLQLSMSFDRTPYQGVKKLPPAHCLTITAQNVKLRQYFELSAEPELKLKDSSDYVTAYREKLEEAVKCRLDSDYPIGSELSGGLDSSTVTAFAARLMDRPQTRLHTFGNVFCELEPQCILAVSRAYRLPNNHIFAGPETEPVKVMERSLALLGYPLEHRSATSTEPFYRLAEQLGIRTLLSGFGGDEFGTTIHGYLIPMELAKNGRYRELFDILPGNHLFRFLRMLKMEWRKRKTGNFTTPSYTPRFYEAYGARWPHRIVRDELVDRYDLKQRYFDETRFDAGYTDLKRFTLEKRWQPFVPTRMENGTLMAAGRSIEYRWPLLDVSLVRLFLSIPSEENYYRGMGRYLHRRAIDGVVPDMVTWKQNKAMGAVIGNQMEDVRHLLSQGAVGLHPALAEYIVTERLQQQLEQFPTLLSNKEDNRRFQFHNNIRATMDLNAWLWHLDTKGKAP